MQVPHGVSAIAELLSWGEGVLRQADVATPRLESQVLLACAAGVRRDDVTAGLIQHIEPHVAEHFRRLIGRRSERVPLAYLRGDQEFHGLAFRVTPSTLVPRPETELLVDAGLAVLGARVAPATVVDACTGSGCVAIALAVRSPGTTVLASDLSVRALSVARANAERHAVGDRVRAVCIDVLQGLAQDSCDVVTANPPYIPSGLIAELQPEVALYEPRDALDGGPDGLNFHRRLVHESLIVLRPGGALLMEVGDGQAATVGGYLKSAGFRSIRVERDLAGIERVVGGMKPV